MEAKVAGTKIRERLVIEGNPGMLTPVEVHERLRALEAIKVHPRDQMENRTVLARGERIFEESLGEVRLHIGRLLGEFEAVPAEKQQSAARTELSRELAGSTTPAVVIQPLAQTPPRTAAASKGVRPG
jgi:molecular chaperone HscC